VDWDTVDFTQSPAIQELPVTSAICDPLHGDTVTLTPEGKMIVRGEPGFSIVCVCVCVYIYVDWYTG